MREIAIEHTNSEALLKTEMYTVFFLFVLMRSDKSDSNNNNKKIIRLSNSCQFPYRKNPNRILTDHYILQHFIGFLSHRALKRSHYFKKTSSVYLQCQGDTENAPSPNEQLYKAKRLHTHQCAKHTVVHFSAGDDFRNQGSAD